MHEGNLYKCETYDFLLPELPIHLTVPPEIVNAKTPKCIQARTKQPKPSGEKKKSKVNARNLQREKRNIKTQSTALQLEGFEGVNGIRSISRTGQQTYRSSYFNWVQMLNRIYSSKQLKKRSQFNKKSNLMLRYTVRIYAKPS